MENKPVGENRKRKPKKNQKKYEELKHAGRTTRKSVHGTRMPPLIVFISPAIKHWVYNK